jgi:hypothetical protein
MRSQHWLARAGALALAWATIAAAQTGKLVPASTLRLNDLQVLGSHNSYRILPPEVLLQAIEQVAPGAAPKLRYDHPTLTRQLDLGVRQLELDVFADPQGGRYAEPLGDTLAQKAGVKTGFDATPWRQPGFKVMHLQGVDFLSHCPLLRDCLAEISRWSAAHPGHSPLTLTLDVKDPGGNWPGYIEPLPLDAALLDELDALFRKSFGSKLITPDEVRGTAATLRDAVLAGSWPTLAASRGRVLAVLDVRPSLAERYRQGFPSLRGRALFGPYAADQPEAAVLIANDPVAQEADIRRWVQQGYIVRTRSDADTVEARQNDHRRLQAAQRSGAQIISTDYYPGAPDPMGLRFEVALPGGRTAQCNPVRVPQGEGCSLE